jgi:hypothetical protein
MDSFRFRATTNLVFEKQETVDIELSRVSFSGPIEEHNEVTVTLRLVCSRAGRE